MQTSFFGNSVDLSNKEPAGEFAPRQEPVPENWYPMVLTEIDTDQKPWGVGAKVKFKVTEGEHSGREVTDYFIITHNQSAEANDIGQRRLRAWCDALGLPPNLQSADPLLYKTVYAKVRVEQGKDYQDKKTGEMRKGSLQNRIDTFKAYGNVAPAATAPAPQYQPQPQAYAPVPQQYAAPAPQPQYQQPAPAPQQYAPPSAQAAAPAQRGPMPWEKRA